MLSPSSLNSFYYFFIFWFKELRFETQVKIAFWPLVNGENMIGAQATYMIYLYGIYIYTYMIYLYGINHSPLKNF